MASLHLLITPLLASALISFLASPLVIWLAWRTGLVDNPKTHRHPKVTHTHPIPRAGGLAIFLSLLATSLIFLPHDRHTTGILAGATLLTLLGLIDDKLLAKNIDLNPYLRLIASFLVAALPIASGIGIAFIHHPLTGQVIDLSWPRFTFYFASTPHTLWLVSDLLALGWIAFLLNAVSMGAKGIDGQLPGITVIAALTIAFLSLKFSADITQWPVIILAGITAGSFLGFLPWNFYPQKIMPGWSGGTLAGYLLAVLSLLATAKVGALLVVLGLPLADTTWAILRRLKSGKSPVWGDRLHLHHRLLDAGLSRRQVVAIYWLFTALLGILALQLNSKNKFYTIIGVILLVGGILWWLKQLSTSSSPSAPAKSSKT